MSHNHNKQPLLNSWLPQYKKSVKVLTASLPPATHLTRHNSSCPRKSKSRTCHPSIHESNKIIIIIIKTDVLMLRYQLNKDALIRLKLS